MARRSRNLSVSQFQQLMERVPKAVAKDLETAVAGGARQIALVMRMTVPKGVDGRNELEESIRVTPGSHPLRKVIRAGGKLTTKKAGGSFVGRLLRGRSKEYDYANAVEFGTQNMHAQPFFYPTYRLMKKRTQSAINRKAKKAIAQVVPLK